MMAAGGIASMLGEPRSGYQGGGYVDYWTMVQESFSNAGGQEGTGMNIQDFAQMYFPRKAEGGRIGFAGGMSPKQIENKKRKLYFDLGRDGFMNMFEYLQSELSGRDLEGSYKEGGRIGYDNGGPVMDLDHWAQLIFQKPYDQLTSSQQEHLNSFKPEKAQGGRIGFKEGEGIMSRVGDMVDIRNVPYYSGKALQGLVNSAETLSKFPFAAGKLGSDLLQKPGFKKVPRETSDDEMTELFLQQTGQDYRLKPTEVWGEALENITPGSWSENLGLTSLVEGMEEKRPDDAKTVGGILGLGTEIAVPTGGAFKGGQYLLNKASKAMGKVKDGKTLNKLVEDKISDSGQSRRDFMSLVGASGLAAGLKWLGLGGILKGAPKKLDDIEIQVRGDADYEYIDEAWSGGTWANVYFRALTKKGQKILDDLVKKGDTGDTLQSNVEEGKDLLTSLTKQDGLYVPGGGSEEAAWIVEKIIAKHKPNWRLNTATKQIYDKKTRSFVHPKGSEKGAYEHSKIYSGKDLNKKNIIDEVDDLIAGERNPYDTRIEVHDEYFDDILDQITTKKAEGGRIGLGAGGPPISGEELKQMKKEASGPGIMDFLKITGSGGMGSNKDIYDQGQQIQGLDQDKYNYNFNIDANIPFDLPKGGMLEIGGGTGFGRDKTETTYKGEPVPFMSGMGESKLGDKWNVDAKITYPIDFNKMLGAYANGGLTKTIPPKKGPMPQGLPSALYNGIMRPRSY